MILLSGIALIRVILHDGYGSRPVPRSHHDEIEQIPSHDQRWLL